MSARGALGGLLGLALIAATASAVAASFGLSPLKLSIAPGEISGSVVVTNTGSEAVAIQARPYRWTQNGTETRVETRDLVLNPPIFTLAPGEQQLVRVASRIAPPAEAERAYRAVFSEVPRPAHGGQSGFRISVAMDIPVFIQPLKPGSPSVAWRLDPEHARLVAENTGGQHFRLRDVAVIDGTNRVHSLPRVDVLARSRLEIELPAAAKTARALRLTGQDDANQPVTIQLSEPTPK